MSGVYSAPQQYLPMVFVFGVVLPLTFGDVAIPAASVTGLPMAVPLPLGQPAQTVSPPTPRGLTPQTLPSAMVMNCGDVAFVPPIYSFTVTDAALPPLVKLVRTRMSPLVW